MIDWYVVNHRNQVILSMNLREEKSSLIRRACRIDAMMQERWGALHGESTHTTSCYRHGKLQAGHPELQLPTVRKVVAPAREPYSCNTKEIASFPQLYLEMFPK